MTLGATRSSPDLKASLSINLFFCSSGVKVLPGRSALATSPVSAVIAVGSSTAVAVALGAVSSVANFSIASSSVIVPSGRVLVPSSPSFKIVSTSLFKSAQRSPSSSYRFSALLVTSSFIGLSIIFSSSVVVVDSLEVSTVKFPEIVKADSVPRLVILVCAGSNKLAVIFVLAIYLLL